MPWNHQDIYQITTLIATLKWLVINSIRSPPTGIPSSAQHFKTTFTSSPIHDLANHFAADIRTKSFDIGDTKGTGNMLQRIFD